MNRLLAVGALCWAAACAAQPVTSWMNEPGGAAIAADAADNVFSARWGYNPAGDIYVAKRNANGTLLWEVRYDNTDTTRHEVATWVDTDSAGNVLVSGTIRSGYSSPVNANSVLMKFAPDGTLLWRRVYDAAFDGSSTRKLLVDASDNVDRHRARIEAIFAAHGGPSPALHYIASPLRSLTHQRNIAIRRAVGDVLFHHVVRHHHKYPQ